MLARYIVPLLSMHINFYVRLFVRVYTSPGEVKKSVTKLSHVYQVWRLAATPEPCASTPTSALPRNTRAVRQHTDERIATPISHAEFAR